MARRRSITLDQESRVLSLYKDGMAIKEIMKDTEIKSEQTIIGYWTAMVCPEDRRLMA